MRGSDRTTLIESILARIREHLHATRRRINQEIKDYPSPIPACDAQFNYLLEERAKISEEIKRLEAIADGGLTREEQVQKISKMMESSDYAGSHDLRILVAEIKNNSPLSHEQNN